MHMYNASADDVTAQNRHNEVAFISAASKDVVSCIAEKRAGPATAITVAGLSFIRHQYQ